MNAPKNPEGKRWSCAGDAEETDAGAAGVAADACGGVWEKAEDGAAAAGETPWVLKENPIDGDTAGAGGAVAGTDCAR